MHDISKIRNFGIIAHIDAGKTTTTERLLYLTGVLKHSGSVDEGTAYTDWLLEEKEHGITIKSAAVKCRWKDIYFNIIDTPGHIDFSSEVHRSLRVLDSTLTIICGVSGVQAQTINISGKSSSLKLPGIIFINKMDRTGASFEPILKQISEKLKQKPLPVAIPYYDNNMYSGIIDIVNLKYIDINSNHHNIPENAEELALIFREEMLDTLSINDDLIAESILSGKLENSDIIKSIRRQTTSNIITPVICGSSLINSGIDLLADSILHYLPSPLDSVKKEGFNSNNKLSEQSNILMYIFKTVSSSKDNTRFYYARIYSGRISKGEKLFNITNPTENNIEIINIYDPDIHDLSEKTKAESGEIVIITSSSLLKSGDTLSNKSISAPLEKIHFPDPVFYIKLESSNFDELSKFHQVKTAYLLDDPTLRYKDDPVTGEPLIGGIGELQIDIFLEMLRNNHKLNLRAIQPQVAYRVTPERNYIETIDSEILFEGTSRNISITFEIKESDDSKNTVILENNCLNFITAAYPDSNSTGNIIKTLEECLISSDCGPYPFINTILKVKEIKTGFIPLNILTAGLTKILSSKLSDINTKLLQPIMKVIIITDMIYTGIITNDIKSRKGLIADIEGNNEKSIIISKIPMKNLFGYANDIRNITKGNADFSILFSDYS